MKTNSMCFNGNLVETTPPTAIWRSNQAYLVTLLLRTTELKSWIFPNYERAKRHSDSVRTASTAAGDYLTSDDLKPRAKLTAADLTWEERYPREYPLTVDWTRF